MRFPFRFIGLFSCGVSLWIAYYLLVHPTGDGVTVGLEAIPAVGLFGFGLWVLLRIRGSRV